jgi:hypothetical protein
MRQALTIVMCAAMFLSGTPARADSPIRVRKADTPVADFGLALSLQSPQDLNQPRLCTGAAHGLTTSRGFVGVAFGLGSRDAR